MPLTAPARTARSRWRCVPIALAVLMFGEIGPSLAEEQEGLVPSDGAASGVEASEADSGGGRGEEAASPRSDPNIEQIIVYGTQTMRDTVVREESKVSFSMDDIDTLQLITVADAFKLIPNTNISPSNRGNNGITIRGVNSEGVGGAGANTRPLAAMVIDGSQQSFAALRRGALSLWDVRRLEVLPGPQSTLFGRNAAAGVVFVETADPTFEWEAAARSTVGWFDQAASSAPKPDQWETAFALSGPIYDDLAFRVSGQWIEDEHGITALDPSIDFLDEGEFQQIRAKLLFEPSFVEGLRVELSGFFTRNRPAVTIVDDEADEGVRWFDYILIDDSIANEIRTTEVANFIADVVWDPHPDVRVYSLTAWAGTEVDFGSPNPAVFERIETRIDSDVSQDLRVLWEPDETLRVLGGFFLSATKNEVDSLVLLDLAQTGNPTEFQNQFLEREALNVALFGEVVWHFLEHTSLTAGLRWDRDEYETRVDFRIQDAQDQAGQTSNVAVPRFILAHDFDDSHTASITIARGYRPGFADTELVEGSDPPEFEVRMADPEFLWNYELGYIGRLFDDRVQLKGNFFYYDFRDMQLPVPDGDGNSVTVNAGEARSFGLEGVIGYAPIDGLDLQLSLGYLNTKLQRVEGEPDFEGKEFPEAPPFSAAALITYRHASGLFASTDWSYRDNFVATANLRNETAKQVSSSSIFNLRVGYEWRMSKLTFFVNNLLDSAVLAGRDNFNTFYVGDRRLIGVQLDLRY